MFKILTILTLLASTNAYLNQNNCSYCEKSIMDIRKDNTTWVEIFEDFYKFCEYVDSKECTVAVSNYEQWLFHDNITKVCQYLGYCDELSLNNYILDIDDSTLFQHYNSILGMKNYVTFNDTNTINFNNTLNFNIFWNITFEEPILDVKVIDISNNKICNNEYTYLVNSSKLIKIVTTNKIHYFNASNINHINSFDYNKQQNKLNHLFKKPNTYFEKNLNISHIDNLYNGTLGNVMAEWNCDKSCYMSIKKLYLEPWNIHFN